MTRGGPNEPPRTFRLLHEGGEYLVLSEPAVAERMSALTPAEREVARAIVQGATNAEIARMRGTSVRTIANQVAMIMSRLGASSRTQIAAKLARLDLFSPPPERGASSLRTHMGRGTGGAQGL